MTIYTKRKIEHLFLYPRNKTKNIVEIILQKLSAVHTASVLLTFPKQSWSDYHHYFCDNSFIGSLCFIRFINSKSSKPDYNVVKCNVKSYGLFMQHAKLSRLYGPTKNSLKTSLTDPDSKNTFNGWSVCFLDLLVINRSGFLAKITREHVGDVQQSLERKIVFNPQSFVVNLAGATRQQCEFLAYSIWRRKSCRFGSKY